MESDKETDMEKEAEDLIKTTKPLKSNRNIHNS
jgi:hypothetical protein